MAKAKDQKTQKIQKPKKLLKKRKQQPISKPENEEIALPSTRSSDDPIPNKVRFASLIYSSEYLHYYNRNFHGNFPAKLDKQTASFGVGCTWDQSS